MKPLPSEAIVAFQEVYQIILPSMMQSSKVDKAADTVLAGSAGPCIAESRRLAAERNRNTNAC